MTGIERLRELVAGIRTFTPVCGVTMAAYDREHREVAGVCLRSFLSDIADQIAREHAEDCFRMGERAADGKVGQKTQHEMALYLLDDWEREAVERERDRRLGIAADVSMSAYDLLPQEEREAIAWVREHGGIEHVRQQWGYLRGRANHADHVDRQLAKRQRQIDESHAALRRKSERIGFLVSELNRANHENHEMFMRRAGDYTAFADEVCKRLAPELRYVEGCSKDVMNAALNALDRRLMPEGMEWLVEAWPRFEDDAPLGRGDEVMTSDGAVKVEELSLTICDEHGGVTSIDFGERVKIPALKVLDADGKPLREGETVWVTKDRPCDAPLAKGDEVTVKHVYPKNVTVEDEVGESWIVHNDHLTHERPDSWERLEEDATISVERYRERYGLKKHDDMTWPQLVRADLVRRAKALAERDA